MTPNQHLKIFLRLEKGFLKTTVVEIAGVCGKLEQVTKLCLLVLEAGKILDEIQVQA